MAKKASGGHLVMIIPDVHFPIENKQAVEVTKKALTILKPTRTVFLGDMLDCGAFSTHGAKTLKELRQSNFIEEEVKPGNDFIDFAQKYTKTETAFVEGNHESIQIDTEVLTDNGWIVASKLTMYDKIASFDSNINITYNLPEALSRYPAPLYSVTGNMSDELVSNTHKIYVDNKLIPMEIGKIKQHRFTYSGLSKKTSTIIESDNELRLMIQAIMGATFVIGSGIKARVQWKLSKPRKIERLQTLLNDLDIKYTIRKATKSGVNKLQPYYICLYSEQARHLISQLNNNKTIPKNWVNLNENQLKVVIEEIRHTYGSFKNTNGAKYVLWKTTDECAANILQLASITNNIPCVIKGNLKNLSGFKLDCKSQYHVKIYTNILSNKPFTKISDTKIIDTVISIQSIDGTLITRRNGKVNFTGNSRITRWAIDHGAGAQSLYDSISPEYLLSKGRSNFKYIPYLQNSAPILPYYPITKNLIAVHGWSASRNSAAFHLDRSKSVSVVYGHVHRQQMDSYRDPFIKERRVAFSVGCLSELQPIYMHSPSAWLWGFGLVWISQSNPKEWTEYICNITDKGRVILPDGTEVKA